MKKKKDSGPVKSRIKSCFICGSRARGNDNYLCARCGALLNLRVSDLDYRQGGGQDVPKKAKSKSRRYNARHRFKIIIKCLDPGVKYSFVDIGSGSGEMLEVSKELDWISSAVGFEPNLELYAHSSSSAKVFASEFNPKTLPPRGRHPRIFAICHVLEHLPNPGKLLSQVRACMFPGDLLYIEVPSYEGRSFHNLKFGWKLWYHEHYGLFSSKTVDFFARKHGFRITCKGRRVFHNEISRKLLFSALASEPLAIMTALARGKSRQGFIDEFMGDYIYAIMVAE